MSNIYELCNNISNRADFEIFLKELKLNFENSKSDWENDTLDLFLEGLYGYNFESNPNDKPTWKEFGEMLLAARVYE